MNNDTRMEYLPMCAIIGVVVGLALRHLILGVVVGCILGGVFTSIFQKNDKWSGLDYISVGVIIRGFISHNFASIF